MPAVRTAHPIFQTTHPTSNTTSPTFKTTHPTFRNTNQTLKPHLNNLRLLKLAMVLQTCFLELRPNVKPANAGNAHIFKQIKSDLLPSFQDPSEMRSTKRLELMHFSHPKLGFTGRLEPMHVRQSSFQGSLQNRDVQTHWDLCMF